VQGLHFLAEALQTADETLVAPYASEDGIVRFVRDVLGVDDIAPYQEEILRALVVHKRVAVRGPHGLGKTCLASWVVLWLITVYPDDTKVPTTASAWRQLEKYLWPEIRKWAARARWESFGINMRRGKELLDLAIKLPYAEAFAVASDNPAYIEGAHAKHLGYVFDEAKAIPAATWDAAEGAFSNAGADTDNVAYALAISTPGEPNGRFYEIHKREPGYEDWWVRHVTLDEAIAAGRISREWAEQRKRQWGEKSAVYQNRVLGEFASSEEDSVIPLSWVEAAVERWHAWRDDLEAQGRTQPPIETFTRAGVDVGYGGDKSVIALRYGNVIDELRYYDQKDTMALVGNVVGVLRKWAPDAKRTERVTVDVNGIGAGVVDRLREQGYKVDAFVAQGRTERLERSGELGYADRRSAAWWNLRELLDPAYDSQIALPPDKMLIGDLTAPKYRHMSGGKIRVESKEDIKERLDRSTDAGDAVVQAFDPGELKSKLPDWDMAVG